MLIEAARLQILVRDIFLAEGCGDAESERIALYLVRSNLTGHDSHGVIRVPRYVGWLREGVLVANQTPTIVAESDAFAVVDAGYGFGQTAGPEAVDLGIRKARGTGVAIVALRHSGHLGRIGEWAERAAQAGLVSVHFVNVAGSVLVAPFGGVDRRFSTAPFAIGYPVAGGEPIVLDFATSAVAEGKVLVASQGGKPLPEGSLIEPDGTLSTDPSTLYGPIVGTTARDARVGPGAIRAFGEHKGSGLALMCELLAGALTGSGCCGPGPRRFCNGCCPSTCRRRFSAPRTPSRPRPAATWSISRAPARRRATAKCSSRESPSGAPAPSARPTESRSPTKSGPRLSRSPANARSIRAR